MGRLAAIPVAYRAGIEAVGYADYQIEDLTGFSPIKTLGEVYSQLRIGQQEVREMLGIRALGEGLERAYPGSVESEGATLLRSVLAPAAMFLRGLRRGSFGKAAKGAAVTFAALGGIGLSQPADELRDEYSGARKVPVRRGAFWGLGYQPFFGGDVSHFEYSWKHKLDTDYHTKSVYGSRHEYYSKYANVFGIPFPTAESLFGLKQLADPAARERKHYYDRPYTETAGRFDEFPVIGTALSELDAHIPILGKDRKRMHVGELLGIPISSASLSDRSVPPNAARRLGITDLPATAVVYEDASDPMVRLREQAAIATEPLGVYKFALEFFGVNLDATRPTQMASSAAIGSFSSEFYGIGFGGLIGQTEFPRRFLLSDYALASKQRQLFNPLRNTMPTWLPGVGSENKSDEDYFLDFLHGDPYARLEAGEARLPGVGYEALNPLHSGVSGHYDAVDKLLILADVAPYSMSFQQARKDVDMMRGGLSAEWQDKVDMSIAQRDVIVNQLSAYSRYSTGAEAISALNDETLEQADLSRVLGVAPLQRAWDTLTHDVLAEIPYVGSKLFPFRDPLERYQKDQIYGDTFADWNRPIETIARPAFYDVARSDPVSAAAKGATMGFLMSMPFGSLLNPFANMRSAATAIPVMAGASAAISLGRTAVTDSGFIPPHKRKEIEAAQYMDMFQYTKARAYQIQAEEMGDAPLAGGFEKLAHKTLVGAQDYFDVRSAMSSSDRKYLNAFLDYTGESNSRLMSALPTYYQNALNSIRENDFGSIGEHDSEALQYFAEHPSIPEDSLLWHPSVPATAAKIKMVQGGINGVSDNLHRFGFYESQGIEANLRFPNVHYMAPHTLSLPNFQSVQNKIMHQMRKLNPFEEHPDRTTIRKVHGSFFNADTIMEQKVDRRDQVYFYMNDLMR